MRPHSVQQLSKTYLTANTIASNKYYFPLFYKEGNKSSKIIITQSHPAIQCWFEFRLPTSHTPKFIFRHQHLSWALRKEKEWYNTAWKINQIRTKTQSGTSFKIWLEKDVNSNKINKESLIKKPFTKMWTESGIRKTPSTSNSRRLLPFSHGV